MEKTIKNNRYDEHAKIIAELTYEVEKSCHKKEVLFCNSKGVSPMEFRCLRYLVDNNFTSVKDLADEVGVTPPRITTLLNKLESKNLIERKINFNDRRIIKVTLSKKGVKFAKKINDEYLEFHRCILESMNNEELDGLFKNLTIFHKTLSNFLNENFSQGGK
jgi:DNA-binding MarR family transcriptional regulator